MSTEPLRFYFVRHGQTDSSRQDRFTGEADIPLNETGLAMARALGAAYAHERWAALYTSPKLRARQTAEPLAKAAGLSSIVREGLEEIRYGAWDGKLSSEVKANDADRYARWEADPATVSPPGGETAVQVGARAMAAFEAIRGRHASGNVMVFSHKATLRILLCALLGIDVKLFRARIAERVASVSIVSWLKTGPRLDVLGDISHLPPELRADVGT